MLQGAVPPPPEAGATPHSQAASVFSRGRGVGWGGLPYFPFYFCSEQRLWVPFCRGGGWEKRRRLCSLRQGARCGEREPCLPCGKVRMGGQELSPALPAAPAAVQALTPETTLLALNCTEEEGQLRGSAGPRTFQGGCSRGPHAGLPRAKYTITLFSPPTSRPPLPASALTTDPAPLTTVSSLCPIQLDLHRGLQQGWDPPPPPTPHQPRSGPGIDAGRSTCWQTLSESAS